MTEVVIGLVVLAVLVFGFYKLRNKDSNQSPSDPSTPGGGLERDTPGETQER